MSHLEITDPDLTAPEIHAIAQAVRAGTAAEDDAERMRTGVVVPAMIALCGGCGAHWKVADLPGEMAVVSRQVREASKAGCPRCGAKEKVYVSQGAKAVAWWVLEGCFEKEEAHGGESQGKDHERNKISAEAGPDRTHDSAICAARLT